MKEEKREMKIISKCEKRKFFVSFFLLLLRLSKTMLQENNEDKRNHCVKLIMEKRKYTFQRTILRSYSNLLLLIDDESS